MRNKFQSPRQTRRDFLKKAAVASVLAASPFSMVSAQSRRVDNIGLQLYSLRTEMAADFEGTLEQLAELGFKEMEFAGYHGRTPAQVRQILDNLGMTSPAAHIGLNLVRDSLDEMIESAATLGQKYIVVPSVPGNERTLDHYQRHAETFNRAGERAKEAGIVMGYHNHSFEFEQQDEGKIGYDYLLNFCEADLVKFELDLFWAVNGGVDPISLVQENPGRFTMLHVKDMSTAGTMVDVGRGVIDFAEIFTHAEQGGFEHYFIEHDNPDDGMNSIAYSFNSLNNLRY